MQTDRPHLNWVKIVPSQPMTTPRALADRYGTTTQTILNWIRRGELKAINIGRTPNGRKPRWRISEAAVAEFEAGRTQRVAAPVRRRKRGSGSAIVEFY
jgi:hypothetical protein